MVLAASGVFSATAEADLIKNAERVARNFLASIDAGSAGGVEKLAYMRESRSQPSGRVTRSPAVNGQAEIEQRKRLGKMTQRTLTKTEVLKEYADYPAGAFVRFTYAVKYDKRESERIERLVIKADNPQRWSVVGF